MNAFFDHLVEASPLFKGAFGLYLLSFLVFALGYTLRRKMVVNLAVGVFVLAFALNTILIIGRWVEAGRAPFKTLYETMLLYPWCVGFVFLILLGLYRVKVLGFFASIMNAAGFAYACYKPDIEIINLPPALQSGWFVPHVVTYFIAYAALFASFCLAILYVCLPKWKNEETGSGFEEFYTRAMTFGYVTLTFGLVMGAVWGKYAWGNYWSWDPKENWALISWFIYVIAIHLRFISGWEGRKLAAVNILGFAAVVFTYLGMSLLPTAKASMHVYQ